MIHALLLAAAVGASPCGELLHHDAGGDYTDPEDRRNLAVVEAFHFTADVENLRRGVSDQLGADLAYTLEHYPNHHRALAAMVKLGLREKSSKPPGTRYPVECWFERALRFRPNDTVVRTLYASYLLTGGRNDAALDQLLEAARLDPANATIHYNLGLLFLKKKDYEQARFHAREAYKLGFPLPGLKHKLLEAKQWDEEVAD